MLTTHEESAAQEAKDQKTLNKKLTKGSGNPRTKKKVAPVGKAVEKQKSGDVEEAEVEVEEMEVDQEVEEDMNMEASGSNSNVAEGSGD